VIEDEYFRLPGKLGEATQVLASLLLAFHARHALVLPATKYSHPESFKLTPNFLFRHRKKKKKNTGAMGRKGLKVRRILVLPIRCPFNFSFRLFRS